MAEEEVDFQGMFDEPEEFAISQPPPPQQRIFVRDVSGGQASEIKLSIVGNHPLWAHVLWNGACVLAKEIDQQPELVQGRSVLELGAGAALPSITCALNGASTVVISDYPDQILLNNITLNVNANLQGYSNVHVRGHRWGSSVADLLGCNGGNLFDVIIMCDLVFNFSEHRALLRTCVNTLAADGAAYIYFSHHRPHLADKDNDFLKIAQEEFEFKVEKITEKIGTPQFEEDKGDRTVRSTVHGFKMTWK
ncbi:hypothetical protein GQ42DRAFT_160034 [Ramicandelaber brevisporus]|nr:hypothetical protein GQ42DRAFT_160034 [Ramicandelaber brevisporus]